MRSLLLIVSKVQRGNYLTEFLVNHRMMCCCLLSIYSVVWYNLLYVDQTVTPRIVIVWLQVQIISWIDGNCD